MQKQPPQKLVVLGATGTIGLNTLDVVSRHPDRFLIHALSAQSRMSELAALCARHRPRYAVAGSAQAASQLKQLLADAAVNCEVLAGEEGLAQVVSDADTDQVVAGIVGAAGLLPVLAAVEAGKRVLLANKEPLVMAGAIVMPALKASKAELIPLDSEHNAIFQCLPGGYRCGATPRGITRIMLTASGGPFRDRPVETLSSVTPEEAIRHPNWEMGPKISVDSASMMNKGLEMIEAAWLFDLSPEQIRVVLHPQSIVHSMVEYVDGSVLAQMGQPDMRTPIAQALGWPERITSGVAPLDLETLGQLEFREVDAERYPCIRLAGEALKAGGVAPTVLNAANEIAVEAFLGKRIAYTRIPELIDKCLHAHQASEYMHSPSNELTAVLAVDNWARVFTESLICE